MATMDNQLEDSVHDAVKNYYGKVVKKSSDVQTGVCIRPQTMTPSICQALSQVHPAVSERFFGCGMTIPAKLDGTRVLDLGSGSGRDCFALSKLVGQEGYVVGVDMTDEMLDFSRDHIKYHMDKFGYQKNNIEFVKGYIEKLDQAGIKDSTFDVIVSNCVINLSFDKRAVLKEACRVLKVGGELFFSDMYVDRILPDEIKKNEVMWGEGLTGALYWKELFSLAKELGFCTPRLVDAYSIPVVKEEFKKIIGDANYAGVTYRLFKLPPDHAPAMKATYKGGITDHENDLKFDFAHTFKKGETVEVDCVLATVLSSSRLNDSFQLDPLGDQPCIAKTNMELDPFEFIARKAQNKSCAASSCGQK